MAGPGIGPNGGQIYIDGFTGGSAPPKSSIREVRINSNPFSPEYDRIGFGRVEIFTRPGTDYMRGQFWSQYNKEAFNSRSPLLAQPKRPPYQQRFFGFNLSGPIKRQRASFSVDFQRTDVRENAFVLATTIENFRPFQINATVPTPQTRTGVMPRIDYTINASNMLTVR